MAHFRRPDSFRPHPELKYVRAPEPIHFPEEELMPEGKTHLVLRTFLFRLLRSALGPEHSVGSEQFVYWNARDPKRVLAPDAFVRLGVPDSRFGSWKTWEQGGVPDLAIEIVSPGESEASWEEKRASYHELGVKELVRFDPAAAPGERLRVWDRVHDDLVERQLELGSDRTACVTLGLYWVVRPVDGEPAGLRLADEHGTLVEVPEETEARGRAEEARGRAAANARAEEEARARAAAEARIRELEAELRRRGER
jgi:Uma2 family endonuclease